MVIGSSILACIVKIAWEREEARLRLVAPTERCFVAALVAVNLGHEKVDMKSTHL